MWKAILRILIRSEFIMVKSSNVNKWSKWSTGEIEALKSGQTASELAKKLGRTVESVANKRLRLGISNATSIPKSSSVSSDLKERDEKYWQRSHKELCTKYEKLLKEQVAVERLVAKVSELAPTRYSPAPAIIRSRKPSGQAQSAVLQFSDTHIGKNTSPNQTLSFGNYNFEVFMARLKYLEESVISITENHITTRVPELVIAMLGDMLDGTLAHSNEVGQLDPIFNQYYAGAHAIAQFFRNLAPHFPKIRVYDVVGNHCVDSETEILTRRGWLRHDEVTTEDVCLGLKKDGKTAVWQPVNEVVKEIQVDRMVKIHNRQFSFRGTEHHRFYYFVPGHPMLNEARWSDIKQLPILVPTAGFCPGDGSGVPDRLIELCAAVLTDGSISKEQSNVIVYQTPKKADWVRDAFDKSGLEFSTRARTRKAPATICGRVWKGGKTTEELSFRLSSSAARMFLNATGLKKNKLPAWVWNMTNAQFKRFLSGLLNGDGTQVGSKSPCLFGKSKGWLDEIQALCAVHGVTASVSSYQPNNTNLNTQWRLNLNKATQVSVGNNAGVSITDPTGEIVWCVRTETENFFCRRDGKAYFTGNTRFQNQRRMPTKNRYSNFDKFLYALIRELVRDIKNIEWKLDAQPYQIFDVQGFTFFCAHGDSLRGGDKTLGVPNHAVGRLVSTATQMMNKYNRKAPNYYLLGHLHRDIVLPHATGSVLVNGGFPGVDEFGLAEMFTPADASQKFFFIHPAYGKTASYDISLKFAQVKNNPPYSIPVEFGMN
jgi:hypothetical protein